MEISPAILVRDLNEFKRELQAYTTLFDQIDIDINVDNDEFNGVETLSFAQVLEITKDYKNKFGIHLMVDEPKTLVDEYINSNIMLDCVFYLHQESDIEELLVDERYASINFAITVKNTSGLKGVEFYNNFSEVQLMTVNAGEQGSAFDSKALEKANDLKAMGYTGKISIDGGVDLETASAIKNFPIDRVSVGSYFAKASVVKTSKEELERVFQ